MPLLTIYKSSIRPHLDYGDVTYDQTYTATFRQKIESVRYNSALAIHCMFLSCHVRVSE